MTATLKGYKFKQRPVNVYPSIWDDKTKTVKPVKSMDDVEVCDVLDSITLAVEAGAVSSFNWPQQFFASKKTFMELLQQLAEYDDCYRITDRWWMALAKLAHKVDEEAFVSSREIANALIEDAEKYGLLDWTKSKKLRYTEKQFDAAYVQAVVSSSMPYELFKALPQTTKDDHNRVLHYCGRFADYEISEERRASARVEATKIVEAAQAATAIAKTPEPAKKAAAKKAPAKKAK
jgi:hypothetical protein